MSTRRNPKLGVPGRGLAPKTTTQSNHPGNTRLGRRHERLRRRGLSRPIAFAERGPVDAPCALFQETAAERVQRWILGTAWALRPCRVAGLPALGRMWLSDLVRPARALPHPDDALDNPPGLCGFVHDLSVRTLVDAHRRGLFTFAHFGPLKWMAPPERCVLDFADFHMSKRLRSRLRQNRFRVTFDRDFEGVIKACAGRRDGKWHLTWITPQIMRAYCDLHDAGYAHSFEVWNNDGELVGGGYGVAVGGAFTIESQFTRESHTSKIGFCGAQLAPREVGLRAQRQQGPDPEHPRHGLPGGAAGRIPGAPRAGDAAAGPARQMGGRNRPRDRRAVEAGGGRRAPRRSRSRPCGGSAPVGALLAPVVGAIGGERLALAEAFCAML